MTTLAEFEKEFPSKRDFSESPEPVETDPDPRRSHIDSLLRESDRRFKVLPRTTFNRLVLLIKNDSIFTSEENQPQPPVRYQLATYLARYCNEETASIIANILGLSKNQVREYCARVALAFRRLRFTYVQWPSEDRKRDIKLHHQGKRFPGAIGFVGGTYLKLAEEPEEYSYSYRCPHKFWAVNLQVVVDHSGLFISYESGWPGATSNAYIWKDSQPWLRRQSYFGKGEWLFGGKGLTNNSHYLMTTFKESELHDLDEKVNRRHKRWNKAFEAQHKVVERTFNKMKKRFRHLDNIRGRDIKEIHHVIESLLVLHNILLELDEYDDDVDAHDVVEAMREEFPFRRAAPDHPLAQADGYTDKNRREMAIEQRRQLVDYYCTPPSKRASR